MGGVRWREELSGYLSFDQTDFNQAMLEGERDGAALSMRISVQIADIAKFVTGTQGPGGNSVTAHKRARVRGHLDCPDLGGRMVITWGGFELLAPANELFDHLHLRMRYRMNLIDPAGRALRVSAFKQIENDPGRDSWSDTTTLFTRLYAGWWRTPGYTGADARPDPWAEEDEASEQRAREQLVATAVLRLSRTGFLREAASFRGTQGSVSSQLRDVLRFGACFFGGLAKAYVGPKLKEGDPSFPRDYPPLRRAAPNDRSALEHQTPEGEEPGWHVIPGRDLAEPSANRHKLERRVVSFAVPDLPFELNLHHLRIAGTRKRGARGPVLLVHGAGVRAEMFYGQPMRETVVDRLLESNYDVWALNWRGSIDLPNNSYTLDQVAKFDHPAAIRKVLEETDMPSLRALVHCQGSVSFVMAAVAGYLKDSDSGEDLVSDVVSSAISLFFDVPDRTWLKQRITLPVVTRLGKGADPQWGIRAVNSVARGLAELSKRTERPCNNVPCQVANFIYGAGWDVLLCHAHMDDAVHAWTAGELGYTPFSLISQVAESSRYGHIMPSSWTFSPPSYVAGRPSIDRTRFTLLGCTGDTMFEALGQRRTDQFLKGYGVEADYVSLEGYGHMDVYWGKDAASDAFPAILAGLEWSESHVAPSDGPQSAEPPQAAPCPPRAPGFRRRWRVRSRPSAFSMPPPLRSRVR